MKSFLIFALLLIAAGCANEGGLPTEEIRSRIVGKTYLMGNAAVTFHSNGDFERNGVVIGSYSVIGSNIYWALGDGIPRHVTITNERGMVEALTFNRDRLSFEPVDHTLVGVGRVRSGTVCPGFAPEFPATMRISRRNWTITIPSQDPIRTQGGIGYNSGLIDGNGLPLGRSGNPLQSFTPEHHGGFSTISECSVDWDLNRT